MPGFGCLLVSSSLGLFLILRSEAQGPQPFLFFLQFSIFSLLGTETVSSFADGVHRWCCCRGHPGQAHCPATKPASVTVCLSFHCLLSAWRQSSVPGARNTAKKDSAPALGELLANWERDTTRSDESQHPFGLG